MSPAAVLMVSPAMRWLRGKSKCRRRPLLLLSSLFFLSACFSFIPAPALKWTRRRKMWRRRKRKRRTKESRSPHGGRSTWIPFLCGRAQRRPAAPFVPRHRLLFCALAQADKRWARRAARWFTCAEGATLLSDIAVGAFKETPLVSAGACAQTFPPTLCESSLFTDLLKKQSCCLKSHLVEIG